MVEAPFRRVMIIGHTDPRKRGTQTVQTHDLLGTIFGHHGQPPALVRSRLEAYIMQDLATSYCSTCTGSSQSMGEAYRAEQARKLLGQHDRMPQASSSRTYAGGSGICETSGHQAWTLGKQVLGTRQSVTQVTATGRL